MATDPGQKITDPSLALEKMRSWCAYQERCQQEARDKLYQFGLWPEAVESIISSLITENFINEERFAVAYAGGKFRIKKWGRIKIRSALKQKRISDYCLKKALAEIDDNDYMKTLQKIIDDKTRALSSEKNKIRKHYKLLRHAQSKGYETDLVLMLINGPSGDGDSRN
jgi:regulatory protein